MVGQVIGLRSQQLWEKK